MTDAEAVIAWMEENIATEIQPWQKELLRHLLEHPDDELVILPSRRW